MPRHPSSPRGPEAPAWFRFAMRVGCAGWSVMVILVARACIGELRNAGSDRARISYVNSATRRIAAEGMMPFLAEHGRLPPIEPSSMSFHGPAISELHAPIRIDWEGLVKDSMKSADPRPADPPKLLSNSWPDPDGFPYAFPKYPPS